MQIIAVTSLKGGVGKTTIAIHLAAALAEIGTTVLLVDLDPQGAASSYFPVQLRPAGAVHVLTDQVRVAKAVVELRPRLDLLPTGPDLAAVETTLAGSTNPFTRLKDAIAATEYEYVVIDTPPAISFLMLNALFAAQSMIVPVLLERQPVEVLDQFLLSLRETKRRFKLPVALRKASIVPNYYEARTRLHREKIAEITERYGELVAQPIRRSITVPMAANVGRTVFESAARSVVAADFVALTREVLLWQHANLRPILEVAGQPDTLANSSAR